MAGVLDAWDNAGTAQAAAPASAPAATSPLVAAWDNAPAVAAAKPASSGIISSAQAAEPGAAPAAAPAAPGMLNEIGRQLGLTARAAGHGVADAVGVVSDPFNKLMGQKPLSQVIGNAVDSVTPAPANALERGVQSVASAAANPVNLLAGPIAGEAATLPALITKGALAGGATAGMQPIQPGDTFGSYAARTLLGAAGGAAGAPIGAAVGKLAGGIGSAGAAVANKLSGAPDAAASAALDAKVGEQIATQAGTAGIDLSKIPASILANVRRQVADALQSGKAVDAAALLRRADFDSLGIAPTLGQVTRDPMQYAQERNLRGVAGAGEPLAQRFNGQDNQLMGSLNGLGAAEATDAYPSGNALMGILQRADAPFKANVDALYQAARDSGGRAAGLDVQHFANTANDALDAGMLGHYVPGAVRNTMNDISSGKIPLNVDTATQFDTVLSQAQRTAAQQGDKATATAVGTIRSALNSTPIDSVEGESTKAAFDAARAAAAQRFATIKSSPALDAALNGATPDNFIQKYVINGKVGDLQALQGIVGNDPQAAGIIRSQFADYLKSKAFGANAAGDKPFAQEAYNRALDSLGADKLGVFFSPQEVGQLQAIGRVGAYIHSQPSGSAVNNSGTAGALLNLLSGVKTGALNLPLVNAVRHGVQSIQQRAGVANALTAQVPRTAARSGLTNPLLPLTNAAAVGGSVGATQ